MICHRQAGTTAAPWQLRPEGVVDPSCELCALPRTCPALLVGLAVQLLQLHRSFLRLLRIPHGLAHGFCDAPSVADCVLAGGGREPLLCMARQAQRAQRIADACPQATLSA